uniref:uncharacterized protein n=1 Tax=Semicossyphus pulcher TaxID=241346 RepID=UPI0037E7AB48
MTKPKMRSCPNCGASNPASRRTCVSCYVCLLKSKEFKEKEKAVRTGKWGQNTLKYRNGARVVASARIMVSKLAALGYNPILFIGKKKKNTVTAETITYMCPEGDGPMKPFLEPMSRAYEYILNEALRLSEESAPPLSPPSSGLLPPPECNTSPSYPSCVPHPSSSPSHSSSPTHLPYSSTFPSPPSPSPPHLPHLSTSSSQTSFPPHSPHPSTYLSPSSSRPLIKSEEENYPLTPMQAPFSPSFHLPPSPSPAQPNVNKSVPKRRSLSPRPTSQPVKKEEALPAQCPPSPRPTVSTVSTNTTGCRNCSKQQMFYYDRITDTRVKEEKEEVKVSWLPCASCGKTWDDSWEPASNLFYFVKI